MELGKHKSSLDDWLGRGTNVQRLWKLIFFFLSRFILVFCLLHYLGVAYPQFGWLFPGPTSEEFWAFCVLFAGIFAVVFYVIRGKRKGSREEQKPIPLPPIERVPAPVNKFAGDPGARRGSRFGNDRKKSNDDSKSSNAKDAEEKREGRHGGVRRATFVSEPELEEERGEDQGDRRE